MKKQKRGFTLLEILLVIALIGILASIVLVAINPTRQLQSARNTVRLDDITKIDQALENYFVANRAYPAGITTSYQDICPVGVTTNCVNLSALVPTYMPAIPKDPLGDNYQIALNPTNGQITLKVVTGELGKNIAINSPPPTTPAELIQAQIASGTLIPTGTQQLVLGQLVYKNNAGTQTYIDPATTTKVCPTGYIAVPGNSMYGVTDFCVMKYEAKAVATNAPTVGLTTPDAANNIIDNNVTATTATNNRAIASVASGFPIGNINQITAASYCSTAGASLITNTEWMTIARNIEAQLSNWTTGTAASSTIGIGGLYRGHSDVGPNAALAAGADNDGYIGTNNSGFSIERRTHTLSNGETIWDMGGNVFEWTNDTILGKDQPTGNPVGFKSREYTSITNYGTLSYDLTRPSNNTWNSTQNMGRIYSDGTSSNNTSYAFIRGGFWSYFDYAGVFSLILVTPSSESNLIGFRCVLR